MRIGDVNMSFLHDDEVANEGIGATIYVKNLNVSTKKKSVYTPETTKASVVSLDTELNDHIESAINNIEGSGWAIYEI